MLAAVVGVAAIPTRAMAHQVQTNYFINEQAGDRLELRTTFSNGQPLKNAKVTVYAPDSLSKHVLSARLIARDVLPLPPMGRSTVTGKSTSSGEVIRIF
ncbi:MAG: hypothetical protein AAGM45_13500 [Cyanobacteria bacterium J06588_5]